MNISNKLKYLNALREIERQNALGTTINLSKELGISTQNVLRNMNQLVELKSVTRHKTGNSLKTLHFKTRFPDTKGDT